MYELEQKLNRTPTNEEIAKMSPEEIRKNWDVVIKSMTAQK